MKNNRMQDHEITIEELRSIVRDFVTERQWGSFHDPKNLAMSISIEAAELMEHFQWLTGEESKALVEDAKQRFLVEDELADVLIYILALANALDTELSEIVRRKMARNEIRFPAQHLSGQFSGGTSVIDHAGLPDGLPTGTI